MISNSPVTSYVSVTFSSEESAFMTSSTRDDSTNIETRAVSERIDPLLALIAGLGARLWTKVPKRPLMSPEIYFRPYKMNIDESFDIFLTLRDTVRTVGLASPPY